MAALTYPVLDFPVYGADYDLGVPGWLQHLDGAGGMPLDGVLLAHGPHPELYEGPGPWVRIMTVPRRRFSLSGEDPEVGVSFLARLARGGERDDIAAAEQDAVAHAGWETMEWSVDGVGRSARLVPSGPTDDTRWAGWVGVGDVFVIVVGEGVELSTVRLADVGDGASYFADFSKPQQFTDSIDASREQAFAASAGK